MKLSEHIRTLLRNAVHSPIVEREMAFIADMFIIMAVSVFPKIGWIIGLLYYLLRDVLPLKGDASFGKGIYNMHVLYHNGEQRVVVKWYKSIMRNVMVLIPVLNIVDFYYLLSTGKRLADVWTDTSVEVSRVSENEQ
ncbi:MAG: hypothetical protein HUJ96_01580 [Marinilabiliaceae bacterium]|nr:hypothetical protein [Marinilabiliaceae bacterium]